MTERDAERCRAILLAQRGAILEHTPQVGSGELESDPDDSPDDLDMAVAEASLSFRGQVRERESQLLSRIDEALERIEQGDYGECTSCGEEIAVKRLLARPVARLCIDCKEEEERLQRQGD